MIKALFRHNTWFFLPYLLFLAAASAFLFTHEKGAMVRILNDWNRPALDWFFVYYTHVGDGIFAAAVTLLVILNNRKQGILLAISLILAGLLSQLLKHSIGAEAMRPGMFFKDIIQFREIFGLSRHDMHSMPSGHSTSAFALFMMLTLMDRKRSYGYLFFTMALLVGISRIYLAQHFLDDVVAGSFLGISISVIIFLLLDKKLHTPTLNQPLFSKR